MSEMHSTQRGVRLSSGFGSPSLSQNVKVWIVSPDPKSLAERLETLFRDGTEYPWVSPLVWTNNHPSSSNAEAASFLAFDVDDSEVKIPRSPDGVVEHPPMPSERRKALVEAFENGKFSFQLMYLTRHGARFLMVLDREVTPEEYQLLTPAFAKLLQDELNEILPEHTSLHVDNTHDLARRFYGPCGKFRKEGFTFNGGQPTYTLDERVVFNPHAAPMRADGCLQYAREQAPRELKPVVLRRDQEEQTIHVPPFPTQVFPQEVEQLFYDFGATIHGPGNGYDFAAMVGLPVLAGAIGCRMNGYVGSHKAQSVLWCCTVAPTGSGKSLLSSEMLKPLQTYHYERYETYQREYKEWQQARREKTLSEEEEEPEPPNENVISGITTVPSLARALVHSKEGTVLDADELPSFFDGMKPSDRATFLTLHAGRELNVKRGGFREYQTKMLRDYYLSVVAGVQAVKLPEMELDKEDGLSNRFLWAILEPYPSYGSILPQSSRRAWESLINACLTLPVTDFRTKLEAEPFIKETIVGYRSTSFRLARAGLSHEGQFYAKASLHFANLTSVLWGMECALRPHRTSEDVPEEVCRRAKRLVDYFLAHSIEAYKIACTPETGAYEKGRRSTLVEDVEDWLTQQFREHGEFQIWRNDLVVALAQSGIDDFLALENNKKDRNKKMQALGRTLKGVQSKGNVLLRMHRPGGKSRVEVMGIRSEGG